MKKFRVTYYFQGSIESDVFAENEEQAEEITDDELKDISETDILKSLQYSVEMKELH
jgi:hypothetical protein